MIEFTHGEKEFLIRCLKAGFDYDADTVEEGEFDKLYFDSILTKLGE